MKIIDSVLTKYTPLLFGEKVAHEVFWSALITDCRLRCIFIQILNKKCKVEFHPDKCEFVTIVENRFKGDIDYKTFTMYIKQFDSNIFLNRTGDTLLVIPSAANAAPYLGLRRLDHEYVIFLAKHFLFFRTDYPWLNTHGLGVNYLHFRFDKRPKRNLYYLD